MMGRALSGLLWASLPTAVLLLVVDADPLLTASAAGIALVSFLGRNARGESVQALAILSLAAGAMVCMQRTGGPASPLFVLVVFLTALAAAVLAPAAHLVTLSGISLLYTVLALAMPADPVLLPVHLSVLAIIGLAVNHFAARATEIEDELKGRAVRDPATGLLMPAFFHARLVTLLETRRGATGNVSVIVLDMLDIGEEHDEERLQAAANAIADHVRGPDFVGRVGATSFGVVLAGETRHVAVKVAARLTRALRERCGLDADAGISHMDCEHVVEESVECARRLYTQAEQAVAYSG